MVQRPMLGLRKIQLDKVFCVYAQSHSSGLEK